MHLAAECGVKKQRDLDSGRQGSSPSPHASVPLNSGFISLSLHFLIQGWESWKLSSAHGQKTSIIASLEAGVTAQDSPYQPSPYFLLPRVNPG